LEANKFTQIVNQILDGQLSVLRSSDTRQTKRVLVTDDNKDHASLLTELLESDWGVAVDYAPSSDQCLRLIDQKKMELALITPQIGNMARKGAGPFKDKKLDFFAVVRLLPNGNIWVVLDKSSIKSIPDMKGHKVAVGPASGGLGVIARTQLDAYGIDYKKDIKPFFMGAGEMAEALKDGAVEAAFLTEELAQMVASTHKIRPLPWDKKVLDDFLAKHPYYGEYSYPANHFKGVAPPVLTVDNGIQLICSKELSDETVYKLTKAIVENLGCMAEIYAPEIEYQLGIRDTPPARDEDSPYHRVARELRAAAATGAQGSLS